MLGFSQRSFLVFCAFIALSGCTSMVALTPDISDQIATAKTPADHQYIADYFARKAAEYEAEASAHEKNANAYGGYPRGPMAWVGHCRSLQQGFAAAAQEARALEQAHRQQATDVAY